MADGWWEAAWPSGLGRWIWNLEVPGSNPPPYCYLDLFSVVPSSTPRPRCVNSQLVSLPPVGTLNSLCSIYNIRVSCRCRDKKTADRHKLCRRKIMAKPCLKWAAYRICIIVLYFFWNTFLMKSTFCPLSKFICNLRWQTKINRFHRYTIKKKLFKKLSSAKNYEIVMV